MSWVEDKNIIRVGDTVVNTRVISSFAGKFTKGTKLKVTGISERGYNVIDEDGHIIIECGWDFKKI
jgi:hypothetical protein